MKDAGMSYTISTRSTGSGATVQGYPSGRKSVVTSVSMASLPHEVGGGSVRIGGGRSFGRNKMSYNKPKYKGKKIR